MVIRLRNWIPLIVYSTRTGPAASRCWASSRRYEQQSTQGYEDALKAIKLDEKNIKAHLLAG
jgi:hypothetical protein